jgi:hypothetical protein
MFYWSKNPFYSPLKIHHVVKTDLQRPLLKVGCFSNPNIPKTKERQHLGHNFDKLKTASIKYFTCKFYGFNSLCVVE